MTVLKGSTFACALGKGPGDFPVSVMCRGLGVLWRAQTDHRACYLCALSTAVCQARTEETILKKPPKCSSASMGAVEVANRLVEGQIRTDKRTTGAGAEDRDQHHGSNRSMGCATRLLVAEPIQCQVGWLLDIRRQQRKAMRRRRGRAWRAGPLEMCQA